MIKYITGIPVAVSVVVAIYTGVNFASKVINQVDANTETMMLLSKDVSINSTNYTNAREEMFREVTQLTTWLGRVEATAQAMEKLMYEAASQNELQALNDSYYKLNDSIRQLEFDLKDLKNGGY